MSRQWCAWCSSCGAGRQSSRKKYWSPSAGCGCGRCRHLLLLVDAQGKQGVKSSQSNDLHLSLYQYVTCPFCCKVRAYLDYNGIAYDIIEVNPVLRQQIKFSKYKKVPIVLVKNGENEPIQINDSSVIISTLASYFMDPKQGLENIKSYYSPVVYTSSSGKDVSEVPNKYYLMYLDDAKRTKSDDEIEEERKWRQWADDVLVHMLSPNIYRTRQEAMQAFNYFSEVGKWEEKFPAWERYLVIYVGAIAMYFVGKRLKTRYRNSSAGLK